jgi:hypothetical protein
MSTSASPALVPPPPRIQRHPYFGVLARMAAHGKFPRRHRPAGVGRTQILATGRSRVRLRVFSSAQV